MSPLLSVENLEVRTAGRVLVSGVSFSLAPGERLGLIGESGSGKSLTALAVLGLLPETMRASGSIALDGHQVVGALDRDLVPLRGRSIAAVFQEPMTALDPLMRIGDQVAEVVRRRSRRDGIRLAKAEIDALRQRPLKKLPYQRRLQAPHAAGG